MNKKAKRLKILTIIFATIMLYATIHFVNFCINRTAIKSFKRLYNTYSRALELTANQMDGDIGCYFSADKNFRSNFSECDKFYKQFATNLKVSKYCKNNSLANGCIPKYKKYSEKSGCAGYSELMMNKYNQTFVMNNNSTLTVFNMPEGVQNPIFAVDSNGKFFPNKTGYDLFSLVVMRSSSGQYYFHSNITHCLPQEKNGIEKLQDIYK